MSAPELVNLTERAQREIRSIFERERPGGDVGLRLGVVGGGCSGLSYEMEFSEGRANDSVLVFEGFRVLLDPKSAIYLKDVIVDFEDGLKGKGFVFRNPNATNTCGCGDSFAV
ncbi:MAG TPA: iron-sulfur cluster assembly accessory protein [Methylomirabilota bacterium]|nr:iron-sulfur cluster assembly accessory protein [Methylomirabilota bacterium]